MSTIRSAILSELRRRNKSVYGFAKGLKDRKVMHSITAMKWLYSHRKVSIDTVEKMMKALNLVIVPRRAVREEERSA